MTGQSSWNVEKEDEQLIATYYTTREEDVTFQIRVIRRGNKVFCYYDYLVNNKVVICYDGRANGYFGITLRMDVYCKRPLDIFRILDTVFHLYILGKGHIYEPIGERYKPNVATFEVAKDKLNMAKGAIERMLADGPGDDEFASAANLKVFSDTPERYNIADCNDAKINKALAQTGYVQVSPQYPSVAYAKLKKECAEQVKAEARKCEALQVQKRGVEMRLSEVEASNRSKDSEISELSKKLKEAGENKRMAKLIEQIRTPLSELAEVCKRVSPQGSSSRSSDEYKRKKSPRFAAFILPLINFCLLVVLVLFVLFSGKGESSEASVADAEAVAATTMEIQQASAADADQTKDASLTDAPAVAYSIDVEGYSGSGKLDNSKYYYPNAKADGEVIADNSRVEWVYENAIKIERDEDRPGFQPTGSPVTIILKVDGKEVNRRQIPADAD